MKKKEILILLPYCIPWIFLTLYGDEAYGIAWQYGAVLAILAVGAGVLREHGKVLLFGNLLSCCVSLLMVRLFGYDEMNYYFKPFTSYSLIAVISAVVFIVHAVIALAHRPKK